MSSRVTAQDVAKLAGVPQPSVIFILHGIPGIRIRSDVRQRVLGAARELNYQLPTASEIQQKVSRKNRVLAVVERRAAARYLADSSTWQMMLGVFQAAISSGFDTLPFAVPQHNGLQRCRAIVRRFQPGGIILSSPQADDLELIDWLVSRMPVVVRGFLPDCAVPSVRVNDYEAGRTATDHLLRLGHSYVAALIHAPLRFPEAAERLRGYEDVLLENDLDINPDMVAVANFTSESGEKALDRLMRTQPQPSAIFASSDDVALGAIGAALRMGVPVPGDLALVGFGDIPAAVNGEPQLTTLRQPAFAIGWMAADLLIRRLSARGIGESSVVLPTELIVRQSCGASREEQSVAHIKVDVIH